MPRNGNLPTAHTRCTSCHATPNSQITLHSNSGPGCTTSILCIFLNNRKGQKVTVPGHCRAVGRKTLRLEGRSSRVGESADRKVLESASLTLVIRRYTVFDYGKLTIGFAKAVPGEELLRSSSGSSSNSSPNHSRIDYRK